VNDAMPTSTSSSVEQLRLASTRLVDAACTLGLVKLAEIIEQNTRRRLDQAVLRVVMLGEIKHGKSSLANALLGRALLPVGVTPTTAVTVEIRSEAHDAAARIISTGARENIALETVSAFARERSSDTAFVELRCQSDHLPAGVELVDTPGVNDLDRLQSERTRRELVHADVLLLVLDATQLLSRTELGFLRDALLAVGGLQRSGAHLLFAINRIDLVADNERAALRAYLERELAGMVSGPIELFETDARTAMRDPQADTHGVREVVRIRKRIAELAERRQAILPQRTRAALLRNATLLEGHADIMTRALKLEHGALVREIEAVEQALSQATFDLAELRRLIEDGRLAVLGDSNTRHVRFTDELVHTALAQIDDADHKSLASLLPGALQDALLTFAHEEAQRLRLDLDQVTLRVLRTHGEQARHRLVAATLELGFRGPPLYLDPPSISLEVGMVAVSVIGTAVMYFGNVMTGMLMTVAGPLATMALREKSLRDARIQAREIIPDAVRKATQAYFETIQGVISAHMRSLEEHIVLASESLAEQLSAVLQQARAAKHAPDCEQALARLVMVCPEIAAIRGELEALVLSEHIGSEGVVV